MTEAQLEKVEYPAVFVLSRYGPQFDPPVKVFADGKVLHSDAELDRRVALFRNLERAAAGNGPAYQIQLVHVDRAGDLVARLRAELDARASLEGAVPEPKVEPEPAPAVTPWPPPDPDPAYISMAMDLARKAFAGNPPQLRRLERALDLVQMPQGVIEKEDGSGWLVAGPIWGHWRVDRRSCNCPDTARWCQHRLAVGLVLKARELQAEAEAAAPEPEPTGPDPAWLAEQDAQWQDYQADQVQMRTLAHGLA